LAEWITHNLGHPYAFLYAAGIVALWGVLGPLFGFSDTWQLVINTGTTIVTFLMVFLLQNTGNRGIDQTEQRLARIEKQNQEIIAVLKDQHKP
jgi:low affinity Fe/Cu permease